MDKSYVSRELFNKAKEMRAFEVFPTPAELDEDLDNTFLIATGILRGVPEVFIVRVEEFHYSEEEEDKETEKILEDQERHIKRVLFLSTQLRLVKRPGTQSSPTPCWMFIPLRRASGFQRMRCTR